MLFKSVRFITVYDVTMARKYTKRNTAYWSSKEKAKVTVNFKNSTIFKDKGKNSSIRVIADLKHPVYQRKKV